MLTRIIGNDLPPRHAEGESLDNLRFILDNEPNHLGCRRRWVLNRIASPEKEREIIRTLDARGEEYSRIPFRAEEYARIGAETDCFGALGMKTAGDPALRRRMFLRSQRKRINYAIPINAARNLAIREARTEADWAMPFDGACLLTEAAWEAITAYAERHPELRYLVVPMARVARNDDVLDMRFRPLARDEPQIMFHRDAALSFDEAYPYGRRDKVELLMRLGVAGQWDRWRDDPWDLPRPGRSVAKGLVGTAGWVFRLASGGTKPDAGPKPDQARSFAREEAILRFLGSLDEQRACQSSAPS